MTSCQQKCEEFCKDETNEPQTQSQVDQTKITEDLNNMLFNDVFTYNKIENKDGVNLKCPTDTELAQGKTIQELCDDDSGCIGYTAMIEDDSPMCLIQAGGDGLVHSDSLHYFEKNTGEEDFPTEKISSSAFYENLKANITTVCTDQIHKMQSSSCVAGGTAALETCKPCFDVWWDSSSLDASNVPEECSINSNINKYSLLRNLKEEEGNKLFPEFPITCKAFLSKI